MVVVQITMHVMPEKQKELVQTLMSLMDAMGKGVGCINYALLCDITDNNQLFMLEEWESREKLDRHFKSCLFGVLLGTKSLLQQSHGINIYTVQKTEGINAVVAARGKRNDGS